MADWPTLQAVNARFTVSVVLPTPPFCARSAIVFINNDGTASGTFPIERVVGGNFDSDVVALRATGTSFAAPIAGMQLAHGSAAWRQRIDPTK